MYHAIKIVITLFGNPIKDSKPMSHIYHFIFCVAFYLSVLFRALKCSGFDFIANNTARNSASDSILVLSYSLYYNYLKCFLSVRKYFASDSNFVFHACNFILPKVFPDSR